MTGWGTLLGVLQLSLSLVGVAPLLFGRPAVFL
jgi:hypothetical protein